MKVPLIRPTMTDKMKQAAMNALESLYYINGPNVKKFEEEFAQYCNTKYAIAVSSGTAAIHLVLIALGIKPKDEIITVSHSFIATASPILFQGATPRFVDIDPETYTMDVSKVEALINENTKAIIPVHLYGHPVDMDPLNELAEKYDLKIIEDACQAHGAFYKKRKTGNLGDAGCFSFFPSKSMTVAGDGGIITTNSEELKEQLGMLRSHGRKSKYEHEILGYNYRVGEVQCAIGREQLKLLDSWIKTKRKIVLKYNKELADSVIIPVEKEYAQHGFYVYVIRTEKRDELQEFLKENEIETGIYYPIPIHLQPVMKKYNQDNSKLKITEKIVKEILALPLYPSMTEDQINYVIEKITSYCK